MTASRRAQLLLSGIALVVGLGGLVVARDLSVAENQGRILLGLGVSFNPLGALVMIAVSGFAAAGALLGSRIVVVSAAAAYLLGAIQVLIQFGRDPNWLGTRGSNLSFFLALAIGLLTLTWLEGQET